MIVHGLSIDSNWYNTCGFLKAKFYTDDVFFFSGNSEILRAISVWVRRCCPEPVHPEPPQLDRRRVDTPLLHMAVHLTSHRGTGRGPRTYIRLQVPTLHF